MSFILDALRKSEIERQRQSAPGLADAQYRITQKKSRFWLPVLAVILAINALVIAVVLINDSTDATSAFVPANSMPRVTEERPAPQTLVRNTVAAPSPMPVQNASATQDTAASQPAVTATVDGQSTVVEIEPPVAQTLVNPLMLPSMQQLVMSGQLSVAPLYVDLHVYAGERAKRFVFINMHKYREGDRLAEGPLLNEITSSGVILSHQGNRFMLDRD